MKVSNLGTTLVPNGGEAKAINNLTVLCHNDLGNMVLLNITTV